MPRVNAFVAKDSQLDEAEFVHPLIPLPTPQVRASTNKGRRRANELSGSEWIRHSVSIWSDISRTVEERSMKHPAAFPEMLVDRILSCFLHGPDKLVLDPFAGTATTLAAAIKRGHRAIGFELYDEFVRIARERLADSASRAQIIHGNALAIPEVLLPNSVDLVMTSPPYWNIHSRRRSADGKVRRPYGQHQADLGNIDDYDVFLDMLTAVMAGVGTVLKSGSYCIVNIMDIRVKNKFFPLHSDLYTCLETVGFELDDIIVWDRRRDYNNLKPLGYPYRFRINRVHEYLLIFRVSA